MVILERRYNDEIEIDAKNQSRALFGKAIHYVLEHHDKTGWAESEQKTTLENGATVSGIIDLYDENKYEVTDYKTCKAWKFIANDFNDWYKQGIMYAYILRKKGYYCNKAKFWAFILDWSEAKLKYGKNYPKSDIELVPFSFLESDFDTIEYFMLQKTNDLLKYEKASDNDLPMCTEKERWYDKKTNKDRRCLKYCKCNKFCSYYKEKGYERGF